MTERTSRLTVLRVTGNAKVSTCRDSATASCAWANPRYIAAEMLLLQPPLTCALLHSAFERTILLVSDFAQFARADC